ncbi:hypothetical protein HFN89_00235 [Rhizobium laguerreae]|nr:hypothetical protein [Rhizobium laguerreae]
MKLSVKFPIMARATRKNVPGECRMLVAHNHHQDVPEVSLRETEIAVPSTVLKDEKGRLASIKELRFYNDRLYRYIAPLSAVSGLLSCAFSRLCPYVQDYIYTSGHNDFLVRSRTPLSRPISRVFQDRLDAMAVADPSRNRVWPKAKERHDMHEGERRSYAEVAGDFTWLSDGDLAESFEMHRSQADKLLLMGGALWYETTSPSIAVDTHWYNYRQDVCPVFVRYQYLPETMNQDVTTMHFPLSAADRALDVAAEMSSRHGMRGVVSLLGEFETSDHSAFSFDTSEDIVRRTAQALAVNLLRFSVLRPDRVTDVGAEWLSGIGELVQTHNPVLGREVDYASALPSLVETFLRLSPRKFGGLAHVQNAQLRKTLPQVVGMLDDLPISVQGFGPTGASPTV